MRIRAAIEGAALAVGVALILGCEQAPPTSLESGSGALEAQSHKKLDIGLCDPGQGGFSIVSTNPYWPMDVGDQWFLEGEEEGEPVSVLITVLDETRTIDGVTTRVVEEREWEDEELVEVSWNYFAEASDGTICYFGEDVDEFEDEEIVHEGAWCADEAGNAPGIIMPADPRPGMTFQMEVAPGVAEDEGKIVGIGPVEVPAGLFTETIRVRESNPLEGDKDFKVYAAGTGILVDGPLELVAFDQNAPAPGPPVPTDQSCGL